MIGSRVRKPGERRPKFGPFASIKEGDRVVYYASGAKVVIGIFDVISDMEYLEKDPEWGEIMIFRIKPVETPPKGYYLNFASVVHDKITSLDLFPNKKIWASYLQGKTCRPLSQRDFDLIRSCLSNPKYRFEKDEKPPPSEMPSHNEIRDMVREIGRLEGKVSETEYPIDSYRLDVAWRKIRAGNPTHVFEVQVGGNFFEALTKLKHAWDKWNSKPIMVTTDRYMAEAKQLLEGSFHEIEHVALIVNWRKIKDLCELEQKTVEIRKDIGI